MGQMIGLPKHWKQKRNCIGVSSKINENAYKSIDLAKGEPTETCKRILLMLLEMKLEVT